MKLNFREQEKTLKTKWLIEDFDLFLQHFNKITQNTLGLKNIKFKFEPFSLEKLKKEEPKIASIYQESNFPEEYRQIRPTIERGFEEKQKWLKKEFLLNHIFNIFEESKHYLHNHREYLPEQSIEYRLLSKHSKESLVDLPDRALAFSMIENPVKSFSAKNIIGSVINQVTKLSNYYDLDKEKMERHIRKCVSLENKTRNKLAENNKLEDEKSLYLILFSNLNLKELFGKKVIALDETMEQAIMFAIPKEQRLELIKKNPFYKKNKIKIISEEDKRELFSIKENKEYAKSFLYYKELYRKVYGSQKIYKDELADFAVIKSKILAIQKAQQENTILKKEETIEYWLVNKLIDMNKEKNLYKENKTLKLERDCYVEFLIAGNKEISHLIQDMDKYKQASELAQTFSISKQKVEDLANKNIPLKNSVLLKNKNINKKIFNSKEFLATMFLIDALEEKDVEEYIVKSKKEQFRQILNQAKTNLNNNSSLRGNKVEEILTALILQKDKEEENNKDDKNNLNTHNEKRGNEKVFLKKESGSFNGLSHALSDYLSKDNLKIKDSFVMVETKKEKGGVKADIVLEVEKETVKNKRKEHPTEKFIGLSIKSSKGIGQTINLGDFITQNLIDLLEEKGLFEEYSLEQQEKIKFFIHFYHNPMAFMERFSKDKDNDLIHLNKFFSIQEIESYVDIKDGNLPKLNLMKLSKTEIGKLGLDFFNKTMPTIANLNLINNEEYLKMFVKVDFAQNSNKERNNNSKMEEQAKNLSTITGYDVEDIKTLFEQCQLKVRHNQFCLVDEKTKEVVFSLKTYVPSSKTKDKNSFAYYKNKGKSRGVLSNKALDLIKPIFKIKQENLLEQNVSKVKQINYNNVIQANIKQKEKIELFSIVREKAKKELKFNVFNVDESINYKQANKNTATSSTARVSAYSRK